MIAVPAMVLAHIDNYIGIDIWVHTYALLIIGAVVALCSHFDNDEPEDYSYFCKCGGYLTIPPYCHTCKEHYTQHKNINHRVRIE